MCKILVAVPSRGLIHASWIKHLLRIVQHAVKSGIDLDFIWCYDHVADVMGAREFLVDKALSMANFDYFLFLDDDVYPPIDVIEKMLNANRDVISGIYWTKGEPSFPTYAFEQDRHILEHEPKDEPFEISANGLGCFMISMDILKEIPKPRFPLLHPLTEKGAFIIGEDYAFCRKIREIGERMWCHPKVLCDHFWAYGNQWYPPGEIVEKLTGKRGRFAFER